MDVGGFLFDCDGVLVDSEVVGLDDVVQFLAAQGFSITREGMIRRFTGMRMDRFQAALRAEYGEVLGRVPSDPEFTALFDQLLTVRRAQRHRMTIVPGAMQTVAAAAGAGVGMAVASSSAQHHLDSKIDRYAFRPYFGAHVYSADHVSDGKPAPDIFLHAATALGVAPADCLVIEDSPNGVVAGIAAGARVWGFTGGGHCQADHGAKLAEAGAEKVFSSHVSLAAHIGNM